MPGLLSALGQVCPSCDHYQPAGVQKCSSCGSAMDGPVSASRPATAPAPAAAPPPAPVAPRAAPPARAEPPPGMRPSARPAPVPPAPSPFPAAAPIPATDLLRKPAPAPAPVPAPAAAPAAPAGPRFGLTILSGYARGQRFRLAGAGCLIGRSKGAVLFPEDPTVAPHHATVLVKEGRLFVRDEATLSGVFVSIGSQETVPVQGLFSVGQRLFRYLGALSPSAPVIPGAPVVYGAPIPSSQMLYGLEEVLIGGRPGRAIVTSGPLLTIGQQHCDLSYPHEEGMAMRHCELVPGPTSASLRDLSGGLATFVRIGAGQERPLLPGDRLRIGGQVLQVEALA